MLLTANDWIIAGLETLSKNGITSVKVEAIARQLNISKGSFYHHFKDRADFLESMLNYWEEHLTLDVIRQLENEDLDAKERFRKLVHFCFSGITKLQSAIHAWANQDERVAIRLNHIEQVRVEYIAKLFNEMGCSSADSAVKAELCYFTFLGWIDRSSRNPELRSTHLAEEFIKLMVQTY